MAMVKTETNESYCPRLWERLACSAASHQAAPSETIPCLVRLSAASRAPTSSVRRSWYYEDVQYVNISARKNCTATISLIYAHFEHMSPK